MYYFYNYFDSLTMKCDIRSAIRSVVEELEKENGERATDLLRAFQKEAGLLFHKNLILDHLDTDQFGIFDNEDDSLREDIKSRIRVDSFEKCTTRDGYSSIQAIVLLDGCCSFEDEHSDQETLALSFNFERQHVKYVPGDDSKTEAVLTISNDEGEEVPRSADRNKKKRRMVESSEAKSEAKVLKQSYIGTHILYKIYVRQGHGKNEPLLSVEVKASGKDPSTDEHIAVVPEEDEDDFEGILGMSNSNALNETSADLQFVNDGKDRFQALLDPESLVNFLQLSRLEFKDVADAVRFLLSFPYFEHEWDIIGYVEDVVIGNDDTQFCDDSMEDYDIVDEDGAIPSASAA